MTKQNRVFLAVLLAFVCAAGAAAEWRMEIESKTVYPGQTDVSLNVTYAFDRRILQSTLPIIVREITPGAFWAGTLPCDTTDADGNQWPHGVAWHPIIRVWSTMIQEMRMSPGCENSGPYDGVSPDHFAINNDGSNPFPSARPDGIVWLTISFDVTTNPGQFEFDTACFTGSLHKIFMIDNTCIDRGPPPGTNEVVFNKGVITIAPCDCGVIWGDVTGDGAINPVDAVVMVNYVYKMLDQRIQPPNCPHQTGDMNCDGSVNPVDNVWFTQYVYNGRQVFPPCAPCTDYVRR